MKLQIREFAVGDFAAYQSWFADERLKQALEGVDQAWLDHVLNDPTGKQFAVSAEASGELVSVAGVCLATAQNPICIITDIAVSPRFRRLGMGSSTVHMVMDQFQRQPGRSWGAYVARDNPIASRFFQSLGWRDCSHTGDDMHYYLCDDQ